MPRKTFVYPHPINAYIIKHLGITVEEFCELYAFSQGTVSSWITRNKKIETLPISFIYSLSLSASKTMDQVYSDLLKLQDDYLLHLKRYRRTKKIIDKEV
ncbi:type III secretion system protein PrgN [Enterococcus faecalis]|uniref:type III secretion system protein PrgN n=1 Tax=Enterococcus faecalis TaxID=1351 RepID=UPI000CF18094|nr:type III secretion system protein PrgN [Enterococcus faecalis]EGO2560795.1 type III secretion system protein PrgN [Enterococcus faecalis]EGO2659996.1 type III secretion system protein PrgN [Enterococcus faecalis]EGO2680257.1 type III secretion system protein PrgN [Enterococcus faecalis]EGO2741283.1 type III secretion system protein PrgN [Enterococcus faecalis]EGO2829030.1 type III secretion system protein PrgN [Enterococcus faecalis]